MKIDLSVKLLLAANNNSIQNGLNKKGIKKKSSHSLCVYLLSTVDVMIDGRALENPGSAWLESNLNPLSPGAKRLGTYQGAFDGCHYAAGRGFWALSCWQIAKYCQLFCEFFYHIWTQNKTY